ncbi:ankyrin repeat-containing domain protein [Mycena alexandri]|uniref:Ankyrin repeat-containing domain protein n=1 Tax=Mycena alexandri TaxID=1745969 RepID=A0AAD6WQ75_9AGAR|nr:ankyrin repeat-containing domain protein [Mycena alexandri]
MPAPPGELHLTIHGGTGGEGGLGGGHGGHGGVGEGPIVNFNYGNKEEERKKIIDWLSPLNFFLRQADISRVRTKGTGEWLLKHPFFLQWESSSESTLWCHGIPGAGKTVLVSMVVDHLSAAHRNNRDIGVACIYLNHKEADTQTPSRLLAGLWRQLVLDRDISSIAENLYKQHQEKGTAPSLEEVGNVLSSSLKEFSQVFIIVDAMDEYPEFQREILLQHLAVMGSNVNLMITSRPNIAPESASFPNLETLDIQAAPGDIQAYINAQIESSPHLSRHIRRKPELREEILTKVMDTADGMFLLAKLYVQFLSTKNTIGHVREALEEPPRDLYDSYAVVMQQIEAQNEDNRKTAHSTLIWVVNAKRPLTVSELTVALAIKPGAKSLNEDYLLDIETVLAVCAGLVIVDKESSVVRLVHYTTQEYLDSIQAQLFPDAQTEITCTLLTFLNFDGYPDSSWTSLQMKDLPSLVEYSQYCLAHATGRGEVHLRKILLEFLRGAFPWKKTLAGKVYSQKKWNSMPWNYPAWPLQPSVLWISAAANLVDTAKFLLDQAPFQPDSEHPEIIVASYYGHTEIVGILLEKGADVNAAGGFNGNSLQAAAAQGHIEIVGILLEKGANVHAAGGLYGSSLQAAAAQGHTEIVCILLENGADVNAAGGRYGSSLQAATAGGCIEIVAILLEQGADVNAVGGRYGSSLQAAAARGHTEIVGALLEKGANVNAARGLYGSPLQAAAAQGHTEIVSILLEVGANIRTAGGEDGRSLQAAAARGHTEIVCILLEKGADVNAAGGTYGSSLHVAAAGGHTEIVCILLEKGAYINAAGGRYGSSLQTAAAGGHTEIVRILLEMGADVNAAGGPYGSSLHVAAAEGHTEIVRILLEKGADVNAAGGVYGNSLQAAAARGRIEIVGILLEKGADVNAAGGRYRSSLQAAAAGGCIEIVCILLEKGADINAAGGFYGSSLQAAAAQGHQAIVTILVEKGAETNAAGGRYGSSLQATATQGHTQIVSILLKKGAGIKAPENGGTDSDNGSSVSDHDESSNSGSLEEGVES